VRKNAIVVGCRKGSIGWHTRDLLISLGWHVEWFDREQVANRHHVDVTQYYSVMEMMLKRTGDYDALIYTAGINIPKTIDYNSDSETGSIYEAWNDTMNVNAKGALTCIDKFTRVCNKKRSIVVLVGSNTTSVPRSGSFVYGASKMALSGLTKHLARDLASKRIAVVQVDFGIVRGTPMTGQSQVQFKKTYKELAYRQKWPEAFTAEQAAEWISFIADKGHFATGNCLKIDGAEA